jgi:GH25 family lysozyme M1 (1,4-beta-N-acetylmuramidase)/uncharacterized protein YraI
MRRIIGPDVSFYQDSPATPQGINFVRMNQASDFVIIRAGQHLGADSDFRVNWRDAKAAGLPRGSYWFYDSRADPRQQADLWFSLLDGDLGELPLFADLEESYNGPYTGWAYWKQFLDRIKSLVGRKEVGIYTAFYYWQSNAPNPTTQPQELEYFHRYPLWIANYGVSEPMVPKPWSANEWLFWQYTASGDGLYYGVESLEIDLNYFNGDAQAFADRFNVPVPTDPTPPEDPRGNQYRVNAGSLYVREGPGTTFPSIGYLVRNDVVEALDTNPLGTWYRVRRLTDGLTGWSASAYLVKITAPPPPPPPGDGDRYRVNAGSLYVREGPGTNYPSIGAFVRNDIVEELEANNNRTWLRVRRLTDGLTGWSSAAYLVKVTTPPPPPPPPPGGQKFRVTASRLHVREGPGTQYRSLGYIELNEIVTQVSVNADQTWRQIQRTDGLIGWSSARYMVPYTAPGPPEPPGTAGDWYQVTATRITAREGPGTSFASKGSLSRDESVQILASSNDQLWIQFRRVDGLTAWAPLDQFRKLGPNPASVMQKILNGVTYYRKERTQPRKITSHILVVDTRVDGFRFLVTPPLRDTLPPLCTQTTSQFLSENGLQIAINGDGYHYLDPSQYDPGRYCPDGGDPVRLIGVAASRGRVYSQGEPGHPKLYMNQRNEITFDTPKGQVYNAIGGDIMLVVKGQKVNGLNTTALHPRTALGTNQNGRYVYFVVVDGRETSEGSTFSELADLLLSQGAYTAMAFDGGGSSTMVIEGVDGRPRLLNTPVNENTPGRERAVANHLGIALKR